MRIIAGHYRSRHLEAPRGMSTRPTSDKLRETLFNVVGARVEGCRFADLYAGSGAVALEAVSRGAAFVWLAESARPALAAIRANLQALRIESNYALETRGVARLLDTLAKQDAHIDVIFLDPPYDAAQDYESTLAAIARHAPSLLSPGAVVVAEHARKQPLAPAYAALHRTRVLEQGDAALSFYAITNSPKAPLP